MRLELDAPNIGELEKEYLLKCIDSTFISTFGPFVGEFEARFRERVDAAAMGLCALGLMAGDRAAILASNSVE